MNPRFLLAPLALFFLVRVSPVRAAEVLEGPDKPAAPKIEITAKSKAAMKRGLDWLVRAQNPDGGIGTDVGTPSDIGCTAISGLAMLANGSTPTEGVYRERLRRIHKFILGAAKRMPAYDITPLTGTQVQNEFGRHSHSFLAALFLSQVAGEERGNTESRRAIQKLVRAIEKGREGNGSWGDQGYVPIMGTMLAWESLRGADSMGVPVRVSPQKTAKYLLDTMRQNLGGGNIFTTAAGIRVLYAMDQADAPIAKRAIEQTLVMVGRDNSMFTRAGGEHYLSFHLITEFLLQKGGDQWQRWFPMIRDKLVAVQNRDGSWTGHSCLTARTFCTAASLLVLEAPYRYLPISDI